MFNSDNLKGKGTLEDIVYLINHGSLQFCKRYKATIEDKVKHGYLKGLLSNKEELFLKGVIEMCQARIDELSALQENLKDLDS